MALAVFAALSIVLAFRSDSLTLLATSFYSLFSALSLAMALASRLLTRQAASVRFPYGWERVEVLGVFALSSLMVFVALFIAKEAFEISLDQHHAPHAYAASHTASLTA